MTTSTSPTGSSSPRPPGPLRSGGGGRARWALTGAAEGNLADHVGDDADAVVARRAAVLGSLGHGATTLLVARQVHGSAVHVVGPSDLPAPGAGATSTLPVEADALVTTLPGVVLGVVVADCVPVLLLDEAAGVVGVAHAGRRGADAGVVGALVRAARGLGADAMSAVVGPSVCGRCYEVPAVMREEVGGRHPAMVSTTVAGTPALDVAAGVLADLEAAEVGAVRVDGCTVDDPALFSVRRDGPATGRSAGLAWLSAAR